MISVAYVDDDPHSAFMICLLCQRQGGIRMHAFSSARDLLENLSLKPVDVIVSDYDLPGMNGVELLATLRSQGDQTPFILFTPLELTETLGPVVTRYPPVWILSRGFTIHGQLHYLVTMMRLAALHPAVRQG
jgi:CheY-like chemotaxis protein